MRIDDLNIREDIIPMFDNGLSRPSRLALDRLFFEKPAAIEEALNRQAILSFFVDNASAIKSLASYKRDIEEAWDFTSRSIDDFRPLLAQSIAQIRVALFFDKKRKAKLIGKANQLRFLFDKIYTCYFSGLDFKQCPAPFSNEVSTAAATLLSFITIFKTGDTQRRSAHSKDNYLLLQDVYRRLRNGDLDQCWTTFFRFDAYLSIARTVIQRKFVKPSFRSSGISIRNFYHPILRAPVKSSIDCASNIIILTGPNMSGKSTLLRSLSLCIYLASLGLSVPADECAVPFFDEVNINMTKRDDLSKGLSHFMMEVNTLKDIVVRARTDVRIFAVFDEIFSGARIDEVNELFERTMSGVARFEKCFFCFSTHFSQLKDFATSHAPIMKSFHLSVQPGNNELKFFHQLNEGWSDVRLGLVLFEQAGLMKLLEPPRS